ncbi:MAG: hypothetical protein KGR25_03075 [Chloroflexi bacterium]|nr:hypothetical protein [Chloroflexota bacterium]
MASSRAYGDPAYVAAHGIATKAGTLPFEDAYCLTQLVINGYGGPYPVGGRAIFSKRLALRLQDLGLVALCGEAPEQWDLTFRLEKATDKPNDWNIPTYAVRVERTVSSRCKLWVLATQEGVDLVEKFVPTEQ